MALQPRYPGVQPVGEFDGLDSELTSFKGGEVVGLTYVSITGTDKSAKDVTDGYVSNTSKLRPAVTKTLVSGMRPLMLADDGISGYGTLNGSVVGASTGQQAANGVLLGPHTALGSGKITCWDKWGFYSVSLDAVDLDENTGLQPTNTTLTGGAALYATAAGLLTPNVALAFESVVVARFIEFHDKKSLVNTPAYLSAATNAEVPSPGVPFMFALINFRVED